MTAINRVGLLLVRFGMWLADIDYADIRRHLPNGHITTGIWRS